MILDLLGYGAFFLATALTYGIICLGLNLQWGQTGLFNVGVAGFVAIGAYASALLTTPDAPGRFGGFDLPIVVGWAGAMVAAGLASLIIGAVTLRLRADYLAITTFGVAISIQLVALNVQGLTGGPFGIAFIPRPFAALQGNALALQPRQSSSWSASSPRSSISPSSGWCAAPGGACCAPSARTRRPPPRSARTPTPTGCRPSPSAARSWASPARCRPISSASSRPTIISPR